MIYDIHAHSYPEVAGEAIVSMPPEGLEVLSQEWYASGIHPWHVKDDNTLTLARLSLVASQRRVVMIGEAGLDKRCDVPFVKQIPIFREQVKLSEIVRKPMIIHCVAAMEELLAIHREEQVQQPWVLHGFRGGVEQWQQYRRAGIRVSLGLHYKEEVLKAMPLEEMLLESDGDSNDLAKVYSQVAQTLDMDPAQLRHQISYNIMQLVCPEWMF